MKKLTDKINENNNLKNYTFTVTIDITGNVVAESESAAGELIDKEMDVIDSLPSINLTNYTINNISEYGPIELQSDIDIDSPTFENYKQEPGTGDEISWGANIAGRNITVSLDDVMKHVDKKIVINPEKIKHLLIDVKRDDNRIEAADLSYPIIVSKYNGEYKSILDGQHRVMKALNNNVDLPAYILDLNKAPIEWVKLFL